MLNNIPPLHQQHQLTLRREHSHSRSHEYSRLHSMQRSGFKQLHSVSHSHCGTGRCVGNKFTIMDVNGAPANDEIAPLRINAVALTMNESEIGITPITQQTQSGSNSNTLNKTNKNGQLTTNSHRTGLMTSPVIGINGCNGFNSYHKISDQSIDLHDRNNQDDEKRNTSIKSVQSNS